MLERRHRGPLLLVATITGGCDGWINPAPQRGATVLATLSMDVDPPLSVGAEAYVCVRVDVGEARGRAVHGLRWTPPRGAVALHHAMFFATAEPVPKGPVPCEPMPTPVAVLPLYAPGGESEAFPEGVSISIPTQAQAFFVELHVFRVSEGRDTASVDLIATETAPDHDAGWVDDTADVPALPPHTMATSTATCRFEGTAHVVAAWPHMHRLGTEFHGTVVRVGGLREPLLDVAWDPLHQPLYPVDAVLAPGDAVETACTWTNSTESTVEAGPFTTDEMCNQGLVIWPQESARCLR